MFAPIIVMRSTSQRLKEHNISAIILQKIPARRLSRAGFFRRSSIGLRNLATAGVTCPELRPVARTVAGQNNAAACPACFPAPIGRAPIQEQSQRSQCKANDLECFKRRLVIFVFNRVIIRPGAFQFLIGRFIFVRTRKLTLSRAIGLGISAPGRTRTCDQRFRRPVLCPLSYRGSAANHRFCARSCQWFRAGYWLRFGLF